MLILAECSAFSRQGWLRGAGFRRLCASGVSMGGCLSTVVVAHTPFAVACCPFLPVHSAEVVWTHAQSAMAERFCQWDTVVESMVEAGAAPAAARGEPGAQHFARERVRRLLARTDIRNYPPSKGPTIVIAARDDKYIPRWSVRRLVRHWGVRDDDVRWLYGGHVTAIVLQIDELRKGIVEACGRLRDDET